MDMNLLYLNDSEIASLKDKRIIGFQVPLTRVKTSRVKQLLGADTLQEVRDKELIQKATEYALTQCPELQVGTTVAVAISYRDLWHEFEFRDSRPFWYALLHGEAGWYDCEEVRAELMPYHIEITSATLQSDSDGGLQLAFRGNVIQNK